MARVPGSGSGAFEGAYDVVFLVSEIAPVTLVDAPQNARDRSQIQRIATDASRASWENRRATPHPNDDPFLAAGSGPHAERRQPSEEDPREGARHAPEASRRGAALSDGSSPGPGEQAGLVLATPEPRSSAGAPAASPGRGILGGEGRRESARARVALGRPPVDLGPAATPTPRRDRPNDDTDAELLAASLIEARADASRRAGRSEGERTGNGPEESALGFGSARGRAGGSLAEPYGPGRGAHRALDTGEHRYRRWLLEQRRRIEERLEFPRSRQLAMDQGSTVVRITLQRDGSTLGAPRVIRSSGMADLDAAALAAVDRSLPFPPIPDDVAPGRTRIDVTLPIDFENPLVD